MMYLLLLIGFILLIKGADLFVDGSSSIAGILKVPSVIIGLTIVAMGTSAPEAAVSINAGLAGNSDISLGNIVGSNIFNILFVVGLSSMIVDVPFAYNFRIDMLVAIAASVFLLLASANDKKLVRKEGIMMLLGYAAYFAYLVMI